MPGRSGKVLTALHPHCQTCRKQAKGAWITHPEYTPDLDRYWAKNLIGLRGGARARRLLFTLDKDDLLGKYLEQDGRCALSGLKMDPFRGGPVGKIGANFYAPNTDRVDSAGHYTMDNIQIVMYGVNLMKSDMPQGVFIELCNAIATKHLFG